MKNEFIEAAIEKHSGFARGVAIYRKVLRVCLVLMWMAAVASSATAEGRGIAEGRLVNRTDLTISTGNTDLEILELSSGMETIKTARTDARGAFRIEGLPDGTPLMLRASYKGANYHGMLRFDANGTANLELEVYEPTSSMEGIRVETANMAFQLMGDHLHAVETFVFVNNTRPPRIYINPEGSFRVSRTPGVTETPQIKITAPGAEMPLTQSALVSTDGESYYSIYPLRPGGTIFEVHHFMPYADMEYVYEKKFFQDISEFSIGVIPFDMTISGRGIEKTEEYAAENFAVYGVDAVSAGDIVTWTFTGGTPGDDNPEHDESTIVAQDGFVGQNALTIGTMILSVFIIALYFTVIRLQRGARSRMPLEKHD